MKELDAMEKNNLHSSFTPHEWINSYLVTYSFAPERNDVLAFRIKKLLADSYAEKIVDCRFVDQAPNVYHDGANTSVA